MSDLENVLTAATVTLSDAAAAGEREDQSGGILQQLLRELGFELQQHILLPDDPHQLTAHLLELSRSVDLVITTGGTGLGPRDFTPEATMEVLEKRLPGVEEALHQAGREKVPTSILSRSVAGVRGHCLIVNLPGSPGAVRDGMAVLAPVLPHAIRLLRGARGECERMTDPQKRRSI